MNTTKFIILTLACILLLSGYYVYRLNTVKPPVVSGPCVPAFVDGGGPYYQPGSPFRKRISPDEHNGETLVVRGKMLRNDCTTPVAGAVLDIWQANETGNYEDAWYRGRVHTEENGSYEFETVIPKGYGEGTAYRPPHIHFKVFMDDKEVITSQMFFPEAAGKPGFEDAYIMGLATRAIDGVTTHYGDHDIILP